VNKNKELANELLRLGAPTEEAQKIIDLSEILYREYSDMLRISCIMYLRRQCMSCISEIVAPQLSSFLDQWPPDRVDESVPQFIRNLSIWTKETAEEALKSHKCTLEK